MQVVIDEWKMSSKTCVEILTIPVCFVFVFQHKSMTNATTAASEICEKARHILAQRFAFKVRSLVEMQTHRRAIVALETHHVKHIGLMIEFANSLFYYGLTITRQHVELVGMGAACNVVLTSKFTRLCKIRGNVVKAMEIVVTQLKSVICKQREE
jgi:hypothetical protein